MATDRGKPGATLLLGSVQAWDATAIALARWRYEAGR
jgi:hypothetical protein